MSIEMLSSTVELVFTVALGYLATLEISFLVRILAHNLNNHNRKICALKTDYASINSIQDRNKASKEVSETETSYESYEVDVISKNNSLEATAPHKTAINEILLNADKQLNDQFTLIKDTSDHDDSVDYAKLKSDESAQSTMVSLLASEKEVFNGKTLIPNEDGQLKEDQTEEYKLRGLIEVEDMTYDELESSIEIPSKNEEFTTEISNEDCQPKEDQSEQYKSYVLIEVEDMTYDDLENSTSTGSRTLETTSRASTYSPEKQSLENHRYFSDNDDFSVPTPVDVLCVKVNKAQSTVAAIPESSDLNDEEKGILIKENFSHEETKTYHFTSSKVDASEFNYSRKGSRQLNSAPIIVTKSMNKRSILDGVSDFLDFNRKIYREDPFEFPIQDGHFKISSTTGNLNQQRAIHSNSITPSPSWERSQSLLTKDDRDIEYIRNKYLQSQSPENLDFDRFQRSRSQSRSMSTIPPSIIIQNDENLNDLEEDEYHHYRRFSLHQNSYVEEECLDDSDYILIKQVVQIAAIQSDNEAVAINFEEIDKNENILHASSASESSTITYEYRNEPSSSKEGSFGQTSNEIDLADAEDKNISTRTISESLEKDDLQTSADPKSIDNGKILKKTNLEEGCFSSLNLEAATVPINSEESYIESSNRRKESTGAYNLIKDGSMYPWF